MAAAAGSGGGLNSSTSSGGARPALRGILKKRDYSQHLISINGEDTHRSLQWDEATLQTHDDERGKRQKIDEPKTPFAYSVDHDGSGSDAEETPAFSHAAAASGLESQLAALEARQANGQRIMTRRKVLTIQDVSEHNSDDDSAPQATPPTAPRTQFELKRKAHYNEFSRVKQKRDKNARALSRRGESISASSSSFSSDSDT